MAPHGVTRDGRIRVARIITRLNVGGPAIQALMLSERLDPARYDCMLVCGTEGPSEGNMLALRGSAVTPTLVPELGRSISPLRDIVAFVRLVRVLRAFRPHVVHTHLAKAGLLGRVAARVAGAPVVVHTFHGNVLRGYFRGPLTAAFIGLERLLARISSRIVAISPGQRRELEELGIGRERIVEIPLGFDLAPFATAAPGSLRAEVGSGPLVGIVARLVPIKAVDVFLRAARRVSEARPNVRFVVVGDGDLREDLEVLARTLGIAESVRFLGWRADLPSIYADLDVLVLTSQNEGTPVSIIEALAAGRAVVATEVGGVGDVLGACERGLLVPRGDADAVAGAIVRLLDDAELRARLGAAGQSYALATHDGAALLRRIDRLYSDLLNSSKT